MIWERDEPDETEYVSYEQLYGMMCQVGNMLRNYGVVKGDRVAICMPMSVHLAVCLLACARIGAVHSVVFAGFSADALAARIDDGLTNIFRPF